MNHFLQISELHPMREQLENALTSLLIFVEAGAVYISTEGEASSPVLITCILQQQSRQDPVHLALAARKLQGQHPNLLFRFITSYRASQGFKKGVPYLVKHCTLQELCYHEAGGKVFQSSRSGHKKLLDRVRYSFQGHKEVVLGDFKVAAGHLERRENLEAGVALFRAYCSLLSWYADFFIGDLGEDEEGGLEDFVSGYDRLLQYVPHIRTLLDQDLPEDREILTLLYTVNCCQRSNTQMAPISWAVLERAGQKFELLVELLERSFIVYAKQYRSKMRVLAQQSFGGASVLTQPFKPDYFAAQTLSAISTRLAGFLDLRGVYCFGVSATSRQQAGKDKAYRKEFPSFHFYLLVLHREYRDNLPVRLQALIRQATGGQHTATVLCQRMQQLRKQHLHHRHFINRIILNGHAVYRDAVYPCTAVSGLPGRDLAFSAKYWRDRLLLARQFLNLAHTCKEAGEELVRNALLQQAVQQLAVAQLELFLGCRPKQYGLGYLLSLLACIPTLPSLFTASEEDLRLRKLLCADLDMLKHKQLDQYSIEGGSVLYQKCEGFYAAQYAVGLKEMKRLENLNA